MTSDALLPLLRCPITGQPLHRDGNELVTEDAQYRYPVSASGVPLFAQSPASHEARIQQQHYDRVASAYLENLEYPHTQEYMSYLDREFLTLVGDQSLGTTAEICCGSGEAFKLLGTRVAVGVGVDVSSAMLESARRHHPGCDRFFVQGDATQLPFASNAFDTVVLLGGIHHVNDRARLFGQIARILKPGGRLLWREPSDDFFLWRWLRVIVYRLAPSLDAETEHPIRRADTQSQLEASGMQLDAWRTFGFLGYCGLMNSDVLVVTRGLRYLPGVRGLTRAFTRIDDLCLRLPGLNDAGAIAMGRARKR